MRLKELRNRWQFWQNADRIGPDIPSNYWRLFFRSLMVKLCKDKFFFFGERAEVRPGAYIIGCSKISLGARVVLRPNTMIFAESKDINPSVIIEDDVMLGSGVHIYVNNHSFKRTDLPIIDQGHSPVKQVILRKGCWIGANVIILPGVIIGQNTVVGAGSIVTKSIPDKVVAAGNPAKIIKYLEPQVI